MCQIAFVYKPHHQHERSMYTEHSVLPYSVRTYILEKCEAKCLIEEEIYYSEGLQYFLEDLKAYELSSDRYIYMFGQYLYRAFECYPDSKIDKYDTCSFIRLYNPPDSQLPMSAHTSMNQYIDDYLWMKEKKIDKDAMIPMDYLWYEKNFGYCREEVLTFWLCRFVIDVCYNLFYRIKTTDFPYSFPQDEYAETQEDLFYCVLLALHNHYLSHHTG